MWRHTALPVVAEKACEEVQGVRVALVLHELGSKDQRCQQCPTGTTMVLRTQPKATAYLGPGRQSQASVLEAQPQFKLIGAALLVTVQADTVRGKPIIEHDTLQGNN